MIEFTVHMFIGYIRDRDVGDVGSWVGRYRYRMNACYAFTYVSRAVNSGMWNKTLLVLRKVHLILYQT